jgi:hypothetical protein
MTTIAKRRALFAFLAAATLVAPAALHAQTEVQVGGVWIHDFVWGPYLGVLHETLIGKPKVDTTWVDLGDGRRQPVLTRVGRVWVLTGWLGGGLVDGPRGEGLEGSVHAQLGITHRQPNAFVDRVGVLADVYGVRHRAGLGASAAIRMKAAFWVHGGVIRTDGSLRPAFGVRVQQTLLAELGRFIF